MRWQTRRSVTFSIFCLGYLLTSYVMAGTTSKVGGNGGQLEIKRCPDGLLITAVEAKVGDTLDRLRFRCTAMAYDGKWKGKHHWTDFTRSDAPVPATRSEKAECGRGSFVAGLQARIHNNTINMLQIGCTIGGIRGQWQSTSTILKLVKGRNSEGNLSAVGMCPKDEFATTAKVRRGWHIDSVQFGCSNKVSDIPIVGNANPLYPSGAKVGLNTLYFEFQKASNARFYQLCVRETGSNPCLFQKRGNPVPAGAHFKFDKGAIPSSWRNKPLQWRVRGCYNDQVCSNWLTNDFVLGPPATELIAPRNNSQFGADRLINFSWSSNPAANAGHVLVIWRFAGFPQGRYPSSIIKRIPVAPGVTALNRVHLPDNLGNTIRWKVTPCWTTAGTSGKTCAGDRENAEGNIVSFSPSAGRKHTNDVTKKVPSATRQPVAPMNKPQLKR